MHTLKLLNQPSGFDVFLVQSEQATPAGATPVATEGQMIRFLRQPQFEGSAELIFEVDGQTRVTQETGSADLREDMVVPCLDSACDWRLQTNCEIFPKT